MMMIRSCHQVHRLVSEGLDRRLPPLTRIGVHLHLLACDACTNFKRDLVFLRVVVHKLHET